MLNIYYFWNVSVFNEIIAIPNSLCRYFSTLSKLISQCTLTGSVLCSGCNRREGTFVKAVEDGSESCTR